MVFGARMPTEATAVRVTTPTMEVDRFAAAVGFRLDEDRHGGSRFLGAAHTDDGTSGALPRPLVDAARQVALDGALHRAEEASQGRRSGASAAARGGSWRRERTPR